MRLWIAVAACAASATCAAAQTGAPYSGANARAIATLSADDVAQIVAGAGWGLALPAELNGWPGPAHVLEASEALGLSNSQRAAVERIHARMRADAIAAGAAYLDAERALDAAFADGAPSAATVTALAAEAGAARARLRAVHLTAHLETAPLLSRHQTMLYARLRGYAEGESHNHGHSGH
jgi:hypothetical protein